MEGRVWRAALPLLVTGAFVRVYHLDVGLPDMVAVDGFKFVGEAARMASSGDWRPHLFQFPGLLTNLLAVLYRTLGLDEVYGQYLAAHVVAACAGIATMLATASVARRVCGAGGQVLALALSAVCIVSVTYSRMPAPDILLTGFLTAAVALVLSDRARSGRFALAGLCGGLAVGAKFTGVVIFPILCAAALGFGAPWRSWWDPVNRAGAAVCVAVVAFVLTTPFAVSSAPAYVQAMRQEAHIQRAGQIGRVQGGYLDYVLSATVTWEQPWLGTSLLGNLGAPGLAVGLLALGLALGGRGGRKVAFLGAVVVCFVVAISGPGRVKAVRFLLPVLPLFYVVLAWGVERVVTRMSTGRPAWVRRLAWGLGALLVVSIPAMKTLRFAGMTRHPPTNVLAYEWGRAHLEPGAMTLLSPFFVDNLARLPIRVGLIENVGGRQYGFPAGIGASPERDPIYSSALVDTVRSAGARYVVLNSYFEGAFSPVPENLRFFPNSVREYQAFRERLDAGAHVVYAVAGMSEGRLGPDITVYELEGVRAPTQAP